MNNTEKAINNIIESEDEHSFNCHTFSTNTVYLMIKLHHMAAREDMAYHVYGGRYELAIEFEKLIFEYRESVRTDLKPLVEDLKKTNFVI